MDIFFFFGDPEMDIEDVILRRKLKTAPVTCAEGNTFTIHCHKCENCGCVWRHDPEEIGPQETERYAEAHRCPGCGKDERWVYMGEELPTHLIGATK
jgi:Zn finger protein HypA/HybF involved in hydrogenase expression